eukprot:scaffold843_cov327-Prasinococcus_capsulatus_cf.AAC.6
MPLPPVRLRLRLLLLLLLRPALAAATCNALRRGRGGGARRDGATGRTHTHACGRAVAHPLSKRAVAGPREARPARRGRATAT